MLRSALAFSALTGKAFRIRNIRGRRSRPGLRPQHLAAVKLTASLCSARVRGQEINSGNLEFIPDRVTPGFYRVDVGTAGSVTLLTQAVLVPALLCGEAMEFELVGGTDVPKAPPVDYLQEVVFPYFRGFGQVELEVQRRGFHPKGQGCLLLRIQGRGIQDRIEAVQRPAWTQTRARIVASAGLSGARVAERIAEPLKSEIDQVEHSYVEAACEGVAVTLWAQDEAGHRLGVSRLGRPRLPSEKLADQCLRAFQERLSSKFLVEEHLADQLIPLLAIAGGEMRCQKLTAHCHTNMQICSLFTGRIFSVKGDHLVSA